MGRTYIKLEIRGSGNAIQLDSFDSERKFRYSLYKTR